MQQGARSGANGGTIDMTTSLIRNLTMAALSLGVPLAAALSRPATPALADSRYMAVEQEIGVRRLVFRSRRVRSGISGPEWASAWIDPVTGEELAVRSKAEFACPRAADAVRIR